MTLQSYEHDATMLPYFGCAQATCHTGPSCPTSRATSWFPSFATLKIQTWPSDDAVASRLP